MWVKIRLMCGVGRGGTDDGLRLLLPDINVLINVKMLVL